MKKIVIVPDSFKGTMTSKEVGIIIEEEIKRFNKDVHVVRIEVADGGEGTVDAFLSAIGGEKYTELVQNPYTELTPAFYGISGEIAIIEMAAAAGLPLVGNRRSVCETTTYGVGQLIKKALEKNVKKIIIGLGGSATNDGGVGAAATLGVTFYNQNGKSFIPVGKNLSDITKIELSSIDKRLNDVEIVAMCDIDNPLCGKTGASAIFGPQKGASLEDVNTLDKGLENLAQIIKRDIGKDVANMAGAGAAGGMGAGVVAFFNATLKSGIDTILDAVSFDDALINCDMVFTGEGKIDGQSARGKVVAGVAMRAQKKNVPTIAIVGDIADDAYLMYDKGVNAIFSINRVAIPYSEAKLRAKDDLRQTIRTLMNFYKTVIT